MERCFVLDYYLVFDLGTTRIKAFAYDEKGNIIKVVARNTKVIFPQPGWVEEDPLEFWEATINTGKEIVDDLGKPKAIAITNQRSSTIIWDKETGDPLYNMITWQDTRTAELAKEYTNKGSFKFIRGLGKFMKGVSTLLPFLKRSRRMKFLISAANFRFGTNQPIMHVRWLMDNVEEARSAINNGRAAFGTMDSWILYKLLGKHITDYTNATATGMFDPFYVRWSKTLLKTIDIPLDILPELVDVMGPYGTAKELEDAPVAASIADQQSSLYSAGGVKKGVIKMTHGTGTFIDINVGADPIPMSYGVYPMVAVKWKDKVYYLMEGIVQAMGSAIDWLVNMGVLESPAEADKYALAVEDTGGVVFYPALAGLGTPYWNPKVKGIIYGLTRAIRKEHLVRALLEGLAMSVAEVLDCIRKASGMEFNEIIADGGASKSDYLLQSIADFSGVKVLRPKNLEGTSRGAFLLAKGAIEGKSLEEAWVPPEIEKEFLPRKRGIEKWKRIKEFALEIE